MHQLIDDIQDHWPLVLLGLGMAWGFVIWVWTKLVSSPKDLRDCRKDVTKEFKEFHRYNSGEHKEIRIDMKAIREDMAYNQKETMKTLLDICQMRNK